MAAAVGYAAAIGLFKNFGRGNDAAVSSRQADEGQRRSPSDARSQSEGADSTDAEPTRDQYFLDADADDDESSFPSKWTDFPGCITQSGWPRCAVNDMRKGLAEMAIKLCVEGDLATSTACRCNFEKFYGDMSAAYIMSKLESGGFFINQLGTVFEAGFEDKPLFECNPESQLCGNIRAEGTKFPNYAPSDGAELRGYPSCGGFNTAPKDRIKAGMHALAIPVLFDYPMTMKCCWRELPKCGELVIENCVKDAMANQFEKCRENLTVLSQMGGELGGTVLKRLESTCAGKSTGLSRTTAEDACKKPKDEDCVKGLTFSGFAQKDAQEACSQRRAEDACIK